MNWRRAGAKFEQGSAGAKPYRYIRTGTNHFSLASTYDWLTCEDERRPHVPSAAEG